MGRALAWLIAETELPRIAAQLGVKVTGRRGARNHFRLAARQLTDGRFLVISDNCDEPLFKTRNLGAISRLGRVFSGAIEEHVNLSAFTVWGKGRKAWSVQHQGDQDPLHLKTIGKLPGDVAALTRASRVRAREAGEEAEIDELFELPLELTRSHAHIDPDIDFDQGEFEQLSIGFWRELWRRTFWWRLLLLIVAGFAGFAFGLGQLARLIYWALELAGLR